MSDLENNRGFWEKMKKDPLPLIGMSGFASIVAYSFYNFRKKNTSTKASVYIIHTRVAAQGLVIGVLTCGIGYSMIQKMRKSYTETHHFLPTFEHNRVKHDASHEHGTSNGNQKV